jgi:molybdopterin-guanine dinucleotide biosynthesis protein A
MGFPPLARRPDGDATTRRAAAAVKGSRARGASAAEARDGPPAGPLAAVEEAESREVPAPAAETRGVVLAGGTSRRMGRDKAALTVGGETLAALAARRLLAVCARVAVADGGRHLVPGLPSRPDGPGQGPAAGILGAARAWPGHPLLVLACDLPRVPAALLAELARGVQHPDDFESGEALEAVTADWVVPRWQRGIEPLCALYRPAALAALAAAVERGVLAPHRLAEAAGLRVHYLEGESLRRFGPPDDLFLNLNTPRDLERWQDLDREP